MARKRLNRANSHQFRLEGDPGATCLEKDFPTDDGGIALSWATGVLMYREGDNRPGTYVPVGDYVLSLVGPIKTEPMYKIRKHDPIDRDQPLVSWRAA